MRMVARTPSASNTSARILGLLDESVSFAGRKGGAGAACAAGGRSAGLPASSSLEDSGAGTGGAGVLR